MKTWHLFLGLIFCAFISCSAQEKSLLIDVFEISISGGPDGTIDFGSGGGSALEVTGATDIKYTGQQSIKIVYDAVPDGYMWIARGFDLDAKNAAWLIRPEDIDWSKLNAISFYVYGSDSKANIAFDIKDNGYEIWRFMVEDNFVGWKKIVCPFNEFFVRTDWQPNNADKNATLDFPLKSFQFEPRPEAKGTLYFDSVELVSK